MFPTATKPKSLTVMMEWRNVLSANLPLAVILQRQLYLSDSKKQKRQLLILFSIPKKLPKNSEAHSLRFGRRRLLLYK